MVIYKELTGFNQFTNFVESVDRNGPPIYLYFTGSKTPTGQSWCPDCVEAEPVVKTFLSELKKEIIFGIVDVGDMPYWKDKACPFRTDSRSKLMVIPTIIKWKGVKRLEGGQCNKRELLEMLFDDDEV